MVKALKALILKRAVDHREKVGEHERRRGHRLHRESFARYLALAWSSFKNSSTTPSGSE